MTAEDHKRRVAGILRALAKVPYSRTTVLNRMRGEPPEVIAGIVSHFRALPGDPLGQENVRATDIESLGAGEFLYRGDLDIELDLAVRSLRRAAAEVNAARSKCFAFEQSFMAGDYARAKSILDSFVRDHGHSLWQTSARVLLGRSQGAKGAIDVANGLASQARDTVVKCCIHLAGCRMQSPLSVAGFRRQLGDLFAESDPSTESFVVYGHLAALTAPIAAIALSDAQRAFDLAQGSRLSLIDRFESTMRHIVELEQSPEQSHRGSAARAALALHRDFGVDRLVRRAALIRPAGNQDSIDFDPLLLRAIDEYTMGEYAKTIDSSIEFISLHPDCIEGYELVACSLDHLGAATSALKLPPASERIVSALAQFISPASHHEEAAAELRRLAFEFYPLRISSQLTALVARLDRSSARLSWATSSFVTPRSARECPDDATARELTARLSEAFPESLAVQLHQSVLSGKPIPPRIRSQIPPERVLRYEAERALAFDDTKGAIEILVAAFGEQKSTRGRQAVLRALIPALLSEGRPMEALARMVHERRSNPAAISEELIADALAMALRENPGQLSRSPLCALALESITADKWREGDPDLVYEALDDLIQARGLSTPEDLPSLAETEPIEDVIDLLMNAAGTEHIVWFGKYRSTQDVLRGRIEILLAAKRLTTNEGIVARIDNEVEEHQRRLAIQQVLMVAERSKVFIDEPGIRATMPAQLVEDIAHYLLLRQMRDSALVILVTGRTEEKLRVIANPRAQVERYFREIFRTIRDAFVRSDDYGLDTFLSVQIRHATLVGHLRSPFESNSLISIKSAKANQYLPGPFWELQEGAPNGAAEAVASAFTEFSMRIDGNIQRLKNELIQVRIEGETGGALLDYSYSDTELATLHASVGDLLDQDAVLAHVFSELWGRTEVVLNILKIHIRDVVATELDRALDELSEKLKSYRSWLREDFQAAIVSCRGAIAHETDVVVGWFDVDQNQAYPDCELDTLVDIAAKWVVQAHGQELDSFQPLLSVAGNARFSGRHGRALLSALYVMLDNVARYSDSRAPWCAVDAALTEHRIRLTVKNRIPAASAENLQAQIPALQRQLAEGVVGLVRKETGTGLVKLGKLIRTDPGRRFDSTIRLEDGPTFVVEVEFDAEGLYARSDS